MAFIIPFNEKILNTNTYNKLPIELINHVFSFGDVCSYIITIGNNCIRIHDFNSHEIIRTIQTFNLLHISVSKCFKYVVGSNESLIGIWNLENNSLVQEINLENITNMNGVNMGHYMLTSHGEPIHTFTPNNKLLIASGNQIKSYILENNIWIEKETYVVPNTRAIIVCLTSNTSDGLFACGTSSGDVYIYNSINNNFIHTFTTRVSFMRSDHVPGITSIAFNQNILVVSSIGRNHRLLNLSTMNTIKIEEPAHQFYGSYFLVKNYMITPCLTKFIGTINDSTYMWDATTGRVIKKLDIIIDDDCSFSPKYTYIVSKSWQRGMQTFEYKDIVN